MDRALPPPPERFDPITARWLTPGGPLHDPQRDGLDPDHDEPVSLVDPVPRELAGPDRPVARDVDGAARRRRRILLAVLVFTVAALLIGGFVVIY
ncbi:MAG: hypothetical protein KDB60_02030 [Propionibacteriaceae bacterium]|nr:hypothetical protein [Propionibacteriaceae bacterium]